jgi:hypothetical protein
MNEFIENIDFYIDEYSIEKQLYKKGIEILKRGWLTKQEFLTICLWKSRRPKRLYMQNREEEIKRKTKSAFKEKDEKIKINHLINLCGVQIPTASAILSVTNPVEYPIIDERCIQSINDLKLGTLNRIKDKTWLDYLKIIRDIAKSKNKTARDIEKGLFAYNRIKRDNEYKNLYD